MSPHVVISYSRSDRETMQKVRGRLESTGLKTWTDESLTPGTSSWTRAIQTAIEDALAVICILSPSSKQSPWVEKEVRYARTQEKLVFPVIVEGSEANAVPFQLVDTEFIDARNDFDSGMDVLIHTLKERLQIVQHETMAGKLHFATQHQKIIVAGVWHPLLIYIYDESATGAVALRTWRRWPQAEKPRFSRKDRGHAVLVIPLAGRRLRRTYVW